MVKDYVYALPQLSLDGQYLAFCSRPASRPTASTSAILPPGRASR